MTDKSERTQWEGKGVLYKWDENDRPNSKAPHWECRKAEEDLAANARTIRNLTIFLAVVLIVRSVLRA